MENRTVTGPGAVMTALAKLGAPPFHGRTQSGKLMVETARGVVDVATMPLAKGARLVCAQDKLWIKLDRDLPEIIALALVGRAATQVVDHALLAEAGHRITAIESDDAGTRVQMDYRAMTIAAKKV